MASTSASTVQKSFNYDVFLSFRGEDTRKSIVDHLYHALQRKGIHTYKDDERITKGKRISDELIGSIEDSRFYIIVFSKDYASSSWCLDELVKIMECQKTSDQRAYPIFYDVEPTEVGKQSGIVGEAFSKHENEEGAGKWRKAMKEAADLAGWELKNAFDGHEAKLIQKVVEEISLELHSIDSSVDGKLIGMESRVKDVVSALETESDGVRMIGIKGMGGAGKTTLARAVFDHMSIHFEGKSFVENVREVSNSVCGMNKLQEQVLSDVLHDQGIKISSVHEGKKMMRRMRFTKVLVVLDDVDHKDQLEALAGDVNWFKCGSRIIITTRDEQVLVAHGANSVQDVNLLSDKEAICLFSRYAFGKEILIQEHKELSRQVVCYAAGLPLTIKVLGSFLCGKTELEWEDAIKRLQTIPLKDTLEKLKMSYIGLEEEDYKEIFLDVACILKGWEKEKAVDVLESCGFHARNGLRVLEQKSLITVSEDGYLGMHDHIEEMGKYIVRQSHRSEPNRHSRLWIQKEIEDILANDSGTDAIQCIKMGWISDKHLMKRLGNMKKLRVLHINKQKPWDDDFEPLMKSLRYLYWGRYPFGALIKWLRHLYWDRYPFGSLMKSLRHLSWDGYPFESLTKSFQADNLVGLTLRNCRIIQFWNSGEKKVLHKLRFLDMSESGLRAFDFEMTPNIETLSFRGCDDLVELHMPNKCTNLKSLCLYNSRLRTLDLEMTPNIETLKLQECSHLVELHMPSPCPKLEALYLYCSELRSLNLASALNLHTLYLFGCHELVELHMPSFALNLHKLELFGCHELVELHMPSHCPNLKSLYLKCTKLRTLDLGRTSDLKILSLEGCRNLEVLRMPKECPNLKFVEIHNSKLRTLNLVHSSDLETLTLKGCHDLFHLPFQCPKLKSFSLNGSKLRTLDFRLTSDLETLSLEECCELVELHMHNEYPKLKYLSLKNSALRNLNLGSTPDLETLSLERCDDLVELHIPFRCPKLSALILYCSKLRTLDFGPTLDLETLSLESCDDLEKLRMPDECPNLQSLSLRSSTLNHLSLGSSPNLETLSIERCDGLVELHMPFRCPKLSVLVLYCSKLRTLDFGPTLDLETLSLERCDGLEELRLPDECPNLQSLSLRSSTLNHLSLGSSPNLETLWLEGCHDLLKVCMPFQCPKLKVLSFECSKLGTLNLQHTPDLETLSLEGCCDLVELHMPFDCPKLKSLSLNNSKLRSLNLGLTPNLERLNIKECFNLVELQTTPIGCLEKLVYLDLSDCGGFKRFSFYKEIQSPVGSLHLTAKSIDTCPLHFDSNLPKFRFTCLYGEPIPSSIGNLGKLISIGLCPCTDLESFSRSICDLRGLRKLTFEGSIPEVPKDLGQLESLEELSLLSTKIKHLPDSICMLKRLKLLELKSCWFIEKLPEDLGRLECLEDLNLTGCIHLRNIPKSICDMKRLKCFQLPNCKLVEYLPCKLGGLECLKELNIEGTGINDLPHGIFELEGLHVVASDGIGFTV